MIKVTARAKINYSLHIVGKRADGYHELDSHVMFAEFGDEITITAANVFSVSFQGEFSSGLNAEKNSIVDAVRWFENHASLEVKQHIIVQKNIPVMAGLGGGTADGAAILDALCQIYNVARPKPEALAILGADVPVSFYGKSARMRGIGEVIEPWSHDAFDILLVNPMEAVETKKVFASPLLQFSKSIDGDNWHETHNDMEAAACALCPSISDIKLALLELGATRVRMTGSGSTIFAIIENANELELKMRERFPQYWVQRSRVKPSALQPDHKAQ